ncbi:hypothetical protein M0R72_22055 [Candidatus Pacearchaeota archaeon]|jgi:hypothetical protein|nr:hypothetical protein [Candidatus Pacearchaeota archaeon]
MTPEERDEMESLDVLPDIKDSANASLKEEIKKMILKIENPNATLEAIRKYALKIRHDRPGLFEKP